MDHRSRRLAHQGQTLPGGPWKPGLLCHPLHHPGLGFCRHAAVPTAAKCSRRRVRGATDYQNVDITDVLLSVVGLHPAGFTGGLLSYTSVLNGGRRERRDRDPLPTQRERGREVEEGRDRIPNTDTKETPQLQIYCLQPPNFRLLYKITRFCLF